MKPWPPTTFLQFEKAFDTSMGTARIMTDAGPAYIKALGNRQGPHALACDWVATNLASWFGLQTFDVAIMNLTSDDEIPYLRGGCAQPGPAFVAKAFEGKTWRDMAFELKALDNPDDITRLVVFDTWTLNCDRHPADLAVRKPNYDNVFLTAGAHPGRWKLIAMDHTHCFTCGRDLTDKTASIDRVKDSRAYGLFPEFQRWLSHDVVVHSAARLRDISAAEVDKIIGQIPPQWQVSIAAARGLGDLIRNRAAFVADNIQTWLWPDGFEG